MERWWKETGYEKSGMGTRLDGATVERQEKR
jgi:hypothetical protein